MKTFTKGVPLRYGVDHRDLDLWADRTGRVYSGVGPFARLPWRVLRRKLAHLRVRGWRR